MIAGNGRFPVLALEAARQAGMEVVAIGIKEEASPEIETLAARCHWISLGALSKLIDICKKEGIHQVMMCGQVKHVKIFSSIVPDWRLVKLLTSLDAKNTDALIGGVAKILADEGITLTDSTLLLKDLLAAEGSDRRKPSSDESAISLTDVALRQPFPITTSDRAWPSPSGLAWPSKPWRVPMPCCAGPPRW
jgi:DUF1009 family protein